MNRCIRPAKFSIRYMVASDLSQCSELSAQYLPSQLKNMLCQRTVVGRVVEVSETVVGFEVHSKHKWLVEILDMGFVSGFQSEAGQHLVEPLQERVTNGWGSVREIICCVPESQLGNQLLLKKYGFVGKTMLASDPPMYRFRWRPSAR